MQSGAVLDIVQCPVARNMPISASPDELDDGSLNGSVPFSRKAAFRR